MLSFRVNKRNGEGQDVKKGSCWPSLTKYNLELCVFGVSKGHSSWAILGLPQTSRAKNTTLREDCSFCTYLVESSGKITPAMYVFFWVFFLITINIGVVKHTVCVMSQGIMYVCKTQSSEENVYHKSTICDLINRNCSVDSSKMVLYRSQCHCII